MDELAEMLHNFKERAAELGIILPGYDYASPYWPETLSDKEDFFDNNDLIDE